MPAEKLFILPSEHFNIVHVLTYLLGCSGPLTISPGPNSIYHICLDHECDFWQFIDHSLL